MFSSFRASPLFINFISLKALAALQAFKIKGLGHECARDSCRMCERFLSNVREIPVECARDSCRMCERI